MESSERTHRTMHLRKYTLSTRFVMPVALLASVIIIMQITAIFLGNEGLCLSQGCQVVDQLTRVQPLIFNIAGLLFFQAVFWGMYRIENEFESRMKIIRLLLLVGLAAEGVLVGFQQVVAGAYCTYCLIILGFIVLLNLLTGIKQLMAGVFLFAVVFLAFASLEYNQSQKNAQATKDGVFASKINTSPLATVFLFFSSTCSHCQQVLEIMRNTSSISMHFNPIDKISSIDVPGVTLNMQYDPDINKKLLNTLGIQEIPVLLERKAHGYAIIKGENAIIAYLDSLGTPHQGPAASMIGRLRTSRVNNSLIPDSENEEGGCSINADCDATLALPGAIPAR